MPTSLVVIGLIGGYIFYLWWVRHTGDKGAPYEGMPPAVVERVMRIADVKADDIFFDLGSGDGRVVIAAAMKGATAYGVELDRMRAWYSNLWIRLLRLEKKAKVIRGDIFKTDLSKATIVCSYLLPETHDKLRTKLIKELKKGTKVVAVGFEFKDWDPKKKNLNGPVYGPIYLYII